MSELSNKISHKCHKIITVNNEYSYKVECIGMIKMVLTFLHTIKEDFLRLFTFWSQCVVTENYNLEVRFLSFLKRRLIH